MPEPTRGIHHITCGAGAAQVNLDFYTEALGLRLVKVSVNQDSPSVYHFFYGDATGQPGADLTFFPQHGLPQGRRGAGQATATSFAVAPESVEPWIERLQKLDVPFDQPVERFGQPVLPFYDPDGLRLELVETGDADPDLAWHKGPVPADMGLCGFFGITAEVTDRAPTVDLLTDLFGFQRIGQEGDRLRLQARGGGPASIVDVIQNPDRGRMGVGIIQHLAWRTTNSDTQEEYLAELAERGIANSGVVERYYFKSVYFREPDGILYEIATDGPGFTVDEPEESLGTRLALPPFLESQRESIEARLPGIRWPAI
ncbi:MAG: ring-cleaving dioxygenase [Thermaerobacterales bacterium]